MDHQPPSTTFTLPPQPPQQPQHTIHLPAFSAASQAGPSSQPYVPPANGQPLADGPPGPNPRGRPRGSGRVRGRGGGSGTVPRGGRGLRGSRGGGMSTMRSSTRLSERNASGIQKLKLSFKNGGATTEASGGRMSSFMGEYDRELDEGADEPLCFEEQFVLRVPGEVAEGKGGQGGLKDMVKGKGKSLEGIEFKFLDSRRAAFKINGTTYSSKLVDLPNIIESQKTNDNKHLFKIADISQMLVVDQPVKDEASITASPLKIDEYIWPHGLTPPMRHVRKRRFRKRMSRLTIEVVEEQTEELLKKDEEAETTSCELLDAHPDPEIDDQYYIDYNPNGPWQGSEYGEQGSEYGGSQMYDDPGSVAPSQMEDWGEGGTDWGTEVGEGEGESGYGGDEGDGTLDQELAAALMEGMGGSERSGTEEEDGISGTDDSDDDGDGDRSDEDEETAERRGKIKQLTVDIKNLENIIEKKTNSFTGGNPIMVKRFEETIAGLQADIQTKIAARQAIVDELGQAEEGAAIEATRQPLSIDEKASSPDDREGKESTAAAETPMPMDADADVDMDEGAYSEAPTPAGENQEVRDSSPVYSDDGDDLFGDDDDDDDDGEDGPPLPLPEGDEQDEEHEDDEDEGEEDEMARMLRAELDGLDQMGGDDPDALPIVQDQADVDAAAALDTYGMTDEFGGFENQEANAADLMASLDFGNVEQMPASEPEYIEGGAGQRRYAVGADDDDSSEDSYGDD
ncbi:hypothetical protein B9479_004089 [Cryptococcus floricola]|uniref:TAFII55 protein conserved region domain-containing protein n=1 Tax=Cryptococcus floricola TaxID=2591691 RepID=A0A5D3AYA8_9TREE|nr:hypothetical protein B9479_004089 [Cryptococcus floricola]